MATYFHWDQASDEVWNSAFKRAKAGNDIRREGAIGDPDEIEFAVVWAPPKGRLAQFRNLKYIFSIGAGVTHITLDADAPLHVPIVRLQDDMLMLDMSCHVIHWVLHFHRFYYRYKLYEADKRWLRHAYSENQNKRIAVLGLGQTGLDACRRLRDLGFDVTGWSRSPKDLDGVTCMHGDDTFDEVLKRADILINLLPLTPATTDLINAKTIAKMPDGAFIINCSRGGTITDTDLLAALDSGKIEAAALDVFREEPLPPENPYWDHPKVSITPHAAAPSNEWSAADFITGHIRRVLDGGEPWPIVDLERGY
ncbi:glyoxylate/hydroxypyruvate reductase A [Rhodobacteraceae bacterium KMM 6894]|nr:glyoxylate/hydroxypyruvate reductase A [Rhodobacteraceae bacterium KMM 6894]